MIRKSLGRGTFLAAVTLLVYLPALRAGFIWDDDSMLIRNPLIHAADGLRQFWCTTRAADYWPMTSTTLWVEWRLWGLQAAGYHATNVALHILAVILLWKLLERLLMPGAFLAALLFAVHPVNVESVAWIAERKNLLALVFFLASIGWYLKSEAGLRGRYGLSVSAFILGLLSKGSIAILPIVLGGIIVSRRRPVRRDFLRLMPFLIIAVALTAVNLWFQKQSALGTIRAAGLVERGLGAAGVVGFYLSKALWPAHLSFVYPQWRIDPARVVWWLPLVAVLSVTAVLAARGPRSFWRAWTYFCVALIPVMGLTDVYFMKYSLVADHYQHLALIGVVAWLAWAWEAWRKAAGNPVPLFVAGVAVAALGFLTWRQCGVYRDDESLFRAAAEQNPDSWMVQNNLGIALQANGKTGEAVAHLERAAELAPNLAQAHYNLGAAYTAAGRNPEAIAQDEAALRLQPDYPAAEGNLGAALLREGRLAEAADRYESALRRIPADAAAQNGMGMALARMGRMPEAIIHFEAALRLQPEAAGIHANLGNALALSGRWTDAAVQFERTLALDPDASGIRPKLEFVRRQRDDSTRRAAHD